MRVAWMTDVHLNFLDEGALGAFRQSVVDAAPDVVLVGGDTAEAPSLERHLGRLATALARRIYFVLGNHDFYKGSVAGVREMAARVTRDSAWLRWLNATDVVSLTRRTALVGHDGFGDARLGDFANSTVRLNDHVMIQELAGIPRATLRERLEAYGDEAGAHLRRVLPRALASHDHVVVLTHVPPWREACWHEGKISNDDWLPFFSCAAAGAAIDEVAAAHPTRTITVLCGHTHGAGEARPRDNVRVLTGAAQYGAPALQPILELS